MSCNIIIKFSFSFTLIFYFCGMIVSSTNTRHMVLFNSIFTYYIVIMIRSKMDIMFTKHIGSDEELDRERRIKKKET